MAEISPDAQSGLVKGALRSIAASFPVLSSLAQAWNEYETYHKGKRIEEFFGNFLKELESIKKTIGEHRMAIQDCQGFPELLEASIEKTKKEFEESKRVRYSSLLARLTFSEGERSHDEKLALIESLDTLSEQDLKVLGLFKGKTTSAIKELRWGEIGLPGDTNQQVWQLACNLAKLESRGLILRLSTSTGVQVVQDKMDPMASRWEETIYRVLPLGESLVHLLFD